MKIVLTTITASLDADLDPRFGRGAFFLLVDADTLEWEVYPNPGINASGGAGSLAAQFLANKNAEAVISGDFGPNAYNALQAAGIPMYLFGACTTAKQAIELYKAGTLQQVAAPTGPGRHRRGRA